MKLIFKESEFDEYINEFLPFLDRDTEFKFMKPHIISAQKEMIRTLGADVFAIAISAYEEETKEDLHNEILYHFRLPILLNAYRIYAPTNDLRHGNNGRKMTNKEDESNPFEWMINRDNENQERSYFREFDNLIHFLEKFKVWQDSKTYKKLRSHFVYSIDILDDVFPIGSRLLLIKLQPGLKQAERKHILPVIGQSLFAKLKDFTLQSYADTLVYYPENKPEPLPSTDPEEEKTLEPLEKEALENIREACVYYALSWAMKRLKVTLFPEGLLQSYVGDRSTSKAKKTPEFLETQLASQEFYKDADEVLKVLQNTISEMNQESEETINSISEISIDMDMNISNDDKFFST